INQCLGHLEEIQQPHDYLCLRLNRRFERTPLERGPITETDSAVRGPGRDVAEVFVSTGGDTTSTLMRPMTTRGDGSVSPEDVTSSGEIDSRCCCAVTVRGDGSRSRGLTTDGLRSRHPTPSLSSPSSPPSPLYPH